MALQANALGYSGGRHSDAGFNPSPAASRPLRRGGLMVLAVLLLTLAYEPFGQWYLAWVAMVPWLLAMREVASVRAAFAWGWMSGLVFFGVNLWWLWTATIPGMVALCLYFALYWGLAAALLRGLGLTGVGGALGRKRTGDSADGVIFAWRLSLSLVLVPAVWISTEWLRAYVISGFPWMLLGHSQSPVPVLCQVADATGVFGISACIMLVNGLIAMAMNPAYRRRPLMAPAALTAMCCGLLVGYGAFRLWETTPIPGPRVMVVQSNHPQLRGGARTVSRDVAMAFHAETTSTALAAAPADLVVWSEAVMPPLNAEARGELSGTDGGRSMQRTHEQIVEIVANSGNALVTGAYWVGGWKREGGSVFATDIRNSVYLYAPGRPEADARYDKTELVLFSEKVPFQNGPRFAHRIMLWLSPPVASQPLTPGDAEHITVFTIRASSPPVSAATRPQAGVTRRADPASPPAEFRFVTPICLENIFPRFISRMIGSDGGEGKRADFIVNISNDGWFSPMERRQHLQQVVFRCIENRVPQARACNTGISGFIDSCGRVFKTLPAGTDGTAVAVMPLDDRTTLYARHGDWFACVCLLGVASAIAARALFWLRARSARRNASNRPH